MDAAPATAQVSAAEHGLVAAIAEQGALDPVIDQVQGPLARFLEGRPPLRSLLDGTWLGHPVHSAVTDVPVGAWTAGCVLDLLDSLGINRNLRQGADAVHAVGLAGALSAALFGLADWSYTIDKPRRVGFVHGGTNLLIAGLYAGSLVARAKGHRKTGVLLSSAGYDLLLFSSWLGGELAYRFGIGVDHTAFQEGPGEWADVLGEGELGEGQMRGVQAQGVPVLLARFSGQVYAIGATCTHLGCPLNEGQLLGDTVVCGCHGSGFRVTDGQVVQGPATISAPRFQVRTQGGRIAVKRG